MGLCSNEGGTDRSEDRQEGDHEGSSGAAFADGVCETPARSDLADTVCKILRSQSHLTLITRRIKDLRAPQANRRDQLKGERAGQWSRRVNDQFRICFRWTGSDAEDVEIVDHH